MGLKGLYSSVADGKHCFEFVCWNCGFFWISNEIAKECCRCPDCNSANVCTYPMVDKDFLEVKSMVSKKDKKIEFLYKVSDCLKDAHDAGVLDASDIIGSTVIVLFDYMVQQRNYIVNLDSDMENTERGFVG